MVQPQKQQLRFQNNYRLIPSNPFNRDVVEKILKDSMNSQFAQYERFDAKTSVSLCRTVSDEVTELIKELKYDR